MKAFKKTIVILLSVIMALSAAVVIAPASAGAATYKENLINAIMNSQNTWFKYYSDGAGVPCGMQFTDLNFDGKPEFIFQQAGGTMRNCDAEAYYLSGTSLKKATSNYKTVAGGSFTNYLEGYYDKTTGKNRILGYQFVRNGVSYLWRDDFELTFNGSAITIKIIASKEMSDPNYSGNPTYTYYNGAKKKISASTYNTTLSNYKKNLVNIYISSTFIYGSNWKNYTAAKKRSVLSAAYDSWSYSKYPPAATSVKLNCSSLGLGVNESYSLIKTISPTGANQTVSWSSSNSKVAAVSSGGVVTGKKSGTATVTVKTGSGKTAKCKVTVRSAPKSIKIKPASLKLGGGEKYTISESTSSGSYANAANLSWSTSNKTVAGVIKTAGTNKAVVAGLGYGNANVSVRTYNGKTASCKVTVYPAPTSVKLSKTSLTLKKGQSYTISESTNSGSYANAANLLWSTTNKKVATVTKGSGNKAVIKAVGKGYTYVKIKLYNGQAALCKVTVK